MFLVIFWFDCLKNILFNKFQSMSNCKACKEKQKQIKVLEADSLFQIKKIKEDLAQEKVTLEIQFQKQTKKVLEKYHKQKSDREEDNANWIQKYDHMINDYEKKIKQVHSFYQLKQSQLQIDMRSKFSKLQQQKQQKYSKTVDLLTKNCNKSIQDMTDRCKQQLRIIKKTHQQGIKKLMQQHEIQSKDVKSNYDSKIACLEKQIADMTQNFNKLQMEDYRKQNALYQDLQQKRKYINHLKSEIHSLEHKIVQNDIQFKSKVKQIQELTISHSAQLVSIKKQFEDEKQNILKKASSQIQNILKKKLEDCQKLGLVVKNIQQKRESEIKIYESNMRQVQELVQERPSRQEDIQKINELKEKLVTKQKQYQKALEQAKYFRLQLNNKEETYCKIFAAYTSPLNIQKINQRKQLKKSRASITLIKDVTSKYNSTSNLQNYNSSYECKREKLTTSKSTKRFNFA